MFATLGGKIAADRAGSVKCAWRGQRIIAYDGPSRSLSESRGTMRL